MNLKYPGENTLAGSNNCITSSGTLNNQYLTVGEMADAFRNFPYCKYDSLCLFSFVFICWVAVAFVTQVLCRDLGLFWDLARRPEYTVSLRDNS